MHTHEIQIQDSLFLNNLFIINNEIKYEICLRNNLLTLILLNIFDIT